MNNNKLQEVLALVENADMITVDNGPMLSGSDVSDVTGEPDNEVVCLSWVDDAGLSFGCKLTEGGIAAGEWVGAEFVCDDHEGQPTALRFFKVTPLTAAKEVADEYTPPKVVVVLEGGLVSDVISTVPLQYGVIDYDTDGADEDEIFLVPQGGLPPSRALGHTGCASVSPAGTEELYNCVYSKEKIDG